MDTSEIPDIEEIVESLSCKQKLDRDKGLNKLMLVIPNFDQTFLDCLLSAFISIIKQPDR